MRTPSVGCINSDYYRITCTVLAEYVFKEIVYTTGPVTIAQWCVYACVCDWCLLTSTTGRAGRGTVCKVRYYSFSESLVESENECPTSLPEFASLESSESGVMWMSRVKFMHTRNSSLCVALRIFPFVKTSPKLDPNAGPTVDAVRNSDDANWLQLHLAVVLPQKWQVLTGVHDAKHGRAMARFFSPGTTTETSQSSSFRRRAEISSGGIVHFGSNHVI
jgi:hypothetical protein